MQYENHEKAVFIIPKAYTKKAENIVNDYCIHPLEKGAKLRSLGTETPISKVKPGNYFRYILTDIPTYEHKIGSLGQIYQELRRTVSAFWSPVMVSNGRFFYVTAWGPDDEPLYNGMILLERGNEQ